MKSKDLRWSPVVPHNLHGAFQIELHQRQHIEFFRKDNFQTILKRCLEYRKHIIS